MTKTDNIILIGPMGAGKSTIGRQLAAALHVPFRDSDREIEKRTGVDIPTIFEFEGEEGFRTRESAILEELCAEHGIVLATGGGAVMREQNRALLRDSGMVVYLKTSVQTQLRRTARDRNRPLLQTGNPRARLEELLRIRDPLYREIAHVIVDTDRDSVRKAVQEISRYYRRTRQARNGQDQQDQTKQ
jgi:shikimate kinase